MEKMRINKFLANKGICSRREADKLIEDGKVEVNGKKATTGEKVDEKDYIKINGKKIGIEEEKKVYILLNKPKKCLCSSKDDRGRKTVVDMVNAKERIYPIGRLDYDTEGLIILTNDGGLYNKVIHPRSEVYKTYIAKIWGKITKDKLDALSRGVRLEDGMTLPAKLKLIKSDDRISQVEISIREGRNRQVRRMFDAVGHKVQELQRTSIGEIKVEDLEIGKWRELSKKEIKYLYNL